MTSAQSLIKVSLLPVGTAVNVSAKLQGGIPAHWKDDKKTAFQNPWPSARNVEARDVFNMFRTTLGKFPKIPDNITAQIPTVRPTWETVASSQDSNNMEKIKSTWLGHACFLIELPVRRPMTTTTPMRGARILFDPVFSDRCSPTQWFGPKRYTQPPCTIEEVPDIDAIVISHNHYDHLDIDTIKTFAKRRHSPHLFVPLGNADLLRSIGIAKEKIHDLDWWEGRRVEVKVGGSSKEGASASETVAFDITCTPSQHGSNRSPFDRCKSLWGSWVVQEVMPSGIDELEKKEGAKVYFAGDTGYRHVPEGANENEVPTCPAFKEIGERWGTFDFAMIPIGAYQPRDFMSNIHCAPQDSVHIFKDIRAKKALGMHWGTWVLTTEEVTEPPRKLAEECKKEGISEEDFTVCKLGETLYF